MKEHAGMCGGALVEGTSLWATARIKHGAVTR